jgi:GAF domain-containing protein
MCLSRDTVLTNSQPIDAFAQLGQITPSELSLSEVFQRVVDLAARTITQVSAVSVTEDAHTPASSGAVALVLDESQYELGHGPCLHAAAATTVELISDMSAEPRWPDWTARAVAAGIHSSLSIGLPTHASVARALNIYATEPGAFDDDAIAVAQAFASFAGLAAANVDLAGTRTALLRDSETAMDADIVVEQAKGIVMAEQGCTAADALAILTTMAQHTGRTVHDVAQALADRTGETP